MAELWIAWKNQRQVSHATHSSLEISQRRRDSHISTAPAVTIYDQKTGGAKTEGCGKVEIQHQDSHFPTAPKARSATRRPGRYILSPLMQPIPNSEEAFTNVPI